MGYADWMKPDDVKARFRVLFATKINKADEMIVTAETQRTQVRHDVLTDDCLESMSTETFVWLLSIIGRIVAP